MYFVAAQCQCRRAASVRLFVTFVHSVKFFSPSGGQTVLVFPHQTSWQYSDGNPPNGVSNAGGVGIDRDSKRIAGYRSMTSAVRDPQLTVVRVVVHRSYGACLFTAQRPPRITRCDQCCKGDASSQWEKANLPLSPHPHPLTDSHQILHT